MYKLSSFEEICFNFIRTERFNTPPFRAVKKVLNPECNRLTRTAYLVLQGEVVDLKINRNVLQLCGLYTGNIYKLEDKYNVNVIVRFEKKSVLSIDDDVINEKIKISIG
jgi:hypothetical protein